MTTVRVKEGDYGVEFQYTVHDNNGDPLDISNASSVQLRIGRKGENTPLVNGNMSFVTDGSDGKVKYSFTSTDLTSAGYYDGVIVVNYSGGKRTTNDFTVHVVETI